MDLVSSLPDELLCHIVSFLPTKNAVLTSVLSKRWLNVWKPVTNLDIDDSVFLHPEAGKRYREDIQESFIRFVDSVLAMRGQSPIKSFSLKCVTVVHPDAVHRWICNVLQRGVSDLDLHTSFSVENLYALPEEMFFSSTLAKLKLRNQSYLYWDKSSLPMLKSLDIGSASIIFSGKFEEIIPSFPVLEELRIGNTAWDELDVTVSSASLRKLSLDCSGCRGFVNPRSVSFDTPNLVSLEYYDLVAEDYPLVNMGKLLEARICLMITDDQVKRVREPNNDLLEADDEVLKFGNVVKLFSGIKNVQKLTLPSDSLVVLSLCTESMPVFSNLKFLGVWSVESRGWQAVPALLRNCSHLETITMEGLVHSVTDRCEDTCPCIVQGDKGRSLRSCPVNRLEIRGFLGTKKEMAMIKHFLAYFPCLKRLDVFTEHILPMQIRNPQVYRRMKEMFKVYNTVVTTGCRRVAVSSSGE